MKILVDRLTASPMTLEFVEGPGWWRGRMPGGAGSSGAPSPALEIRVQAQKMGEDLQVEGEIRGEFSLECSRCLARYCHPLRESFRLVLEPAGSRVPADPEAAAALARDGLCVEDEFETGWYQGGVLELDDVCFEVISLALPVKPLCQEDCAGLCTRCGANLSEGACSCEEAVPESPFAVLAALRAQGTEGVK